MRDVDLTEEWRPVVGWEGLYSVSNTGLVRRDSRGVYDGYKRLKPAGCMVRLELTRYGYHEVRLHNKKKAYRHRVHTLVMAAFVGPRQVGMEVNHKNSIRTDNRLQNLEYVTRRQNIHHARDLGKMAWKLTPEKVLEIRRLRSSGMTMKAMASIFGVSSTSIQRVCSGRNWHHITDHQGDMGVFQSPPASE